MSESVGFVGIGLGSPGQPHIVVRYMSIDDARHLRLAALIGTVWNVVLGTGAVLIGLVGRALFPLVEAFRAVLSIGAHISGPSKPPTKKKSAGVRADPL